jgi:hypothetical protein
MKTTLLAAAVVVMLLTALRGSLVPGAAPSPFPNVTIPGVPPTGNCCLWQISKTAQGRRDASFGTPYACGTGQTARGTAQIRLNLSSAGATCDQINLIPNSSRLEASGNLIRRADGFGHFMGKFTINNPAGAVLFSGTLETIDRIGSHHPPFGTETCNQQGHLEGWLVGSGSPPLSNFTLRALIVARASTFSAPVTASIDGTLIKCP